jgi:4-amino-4-deoxy-L-arabinose transferase-like glycosyltransferase
MSTTPETLAHHLSPIENDIDQEHSICHNLACDRENRLRLFRVMEPVDLSRQATTLETHATGSPSTANASQPHATALTDNDLRWRKLAWIAIGLAAILFFTRLGARALWASEFRWAEIAREMQLTSNFFWPTINGRPYYDKPLVTYWLVVASTWLTGGMNEAAARLPCAIAGMMAVVFLISIGRRLYDLKTGVIAAFVLATSFSFVFFSRNASADVETIAGELGALILFLRYERDQDGWWVLALWLVMALTSQMKGLLGFVLPITVIGSYCILGNGWAELGRALLTGPLSQRMRWIADRERWFFNWKSPLAIAIAAAIYYVPFAISNMETGSAKGLAMVYRENVQRYFEPFDHRGPIYLYTYVIFALMAPWSAILPAAIAGMHQSRSQVSEDSTRVHSDRFTMTFFWATFVFFTLSGSRRSYYILPIVPAAAIMIARLIDRPFEQMSRIARTLFKIGFGVVVAAVALSTLAFLPPAHFLPAPWSQLPPIPNPAIFAIGWIGSIAAIVYGLQSFRPERVGIAIGIIAWLFMFYFFVFAMPAGDSFRSEKPFAAQVRTLIGNDPATLVFFRNQGPVFYLGLPRPVPEYDKLADLNNAVSSGRVQWLIVRRRDIGLLKFKNEPVIAETLYPWEPKEHGLNSMVLVRVPPSPT